MCHSQHTLKPANYSNRELDAHDNKQVVTATGYRNWDWTALLLNMLFAT
jgi:hypothetical protein